MRFFSLVGVLTLSLPVYSTILQNGQVRDTNFLDTNYDGSLDEFQSYDATASEISYKGRWDSKQVSWWSYVAYSYMAVSTTPKW